MATISCYRVIDSTGQAVPDAHMPHSIDQTTAVRLYKTMVSLQTADTIFYEAQRQVSKCKGCFRVYLIKEPAWRICSCFFF